MRVKSLLAENFRNYKFLDIDLDADTIILFGPNGQGKTNILEAVYLTSCLRSHRTARDRDLIMEGEAGYRVQTHYVDEDIDKDFLQNLQIEYVDGSSLDSSNSRPRRKISHNGIDIEKTTDFFGLFNAVIFAPEDLNIIKEGPSNRRRFLDLLISQFSPLYFDNLLVYKKVLSQRNSLLRLMRDGKNPTDYELMAVWDLVLAERGSAIMESRNIFTKKVEEYAGKQHYLLSSEKEELNVRYKNFLTNHLDSGLDSMKELYKSKLKTNFYEDVKRGTTAHGIHRDDLEILLNGSAVRPFSSQGQLRTAVLSLKFAELKIINEETGKMPVLLLDDVFSELDESRRSLLLSGMGGAQTLITGTDLSHSFSRISELGGDRSLKCYSVDSAKVTLENML